ncbi:succinic semialdehyde dehydrogenase [Microlunatus sp. GCM10028923]|uniref:succinic semialdehyde dehydrogenase n=1 Tax=Microlunatus sp. GCM10028923 TaxID=3273400 RepID=UPI00361C9BE7
MDGQRALPPTLAPARLDHLRRGISGTGPLQQTLLPFTGEPLTELPTSTADDLDAAADRARAAQAGWAEMPTRERAAVGLRLQELILDRSGALLDVIQAETGKARGHAFTELLEVALLTRFLGLVTPATLAPRSLPGALPIFTQVRQHRTPVGLVGLISPWNYPFSLGVGDGLAALLAGNALLHKPDSQTVLTALLGRELIIEAGLPADLWQIVVGPGGEVGPAVIDRSDQVIFTGSTATGRQVAERAARRMIKTSLELGGKNPMIIRADADLDRAVPGAVAACFSSAGQLCESIERIYVHRAVAADFTRRFAAVTDRLVVGTGFGDDYDIGSLTSAGQLAKVDDHVTDAVALGARVLSGGRPVPEAGPYCYRPTVLTDVPSTARCYREETFGPVVAITPVESDDEAVALAADSEYGLNASIWSADARAARALAARLPSGKININDGFAAAYGSVHASIGGWGRSGGGHRHGREALLSVTRVQTVARQVGVPTGEFGPFRGLSYRRLMSDVLRAVRILPGR